MSSVSMSSGYSASLMSSLQPSRAADSAKPTDLFGKIDTSGDGSVDSSELTSFLDQIGQATGTSGIDSKSLMTSLDSDGDGGISSTEFSDNVQSLFDQLRGQLRGSQMQAPPPPPDSSEMFASIDSDGDGAITQTELDGFLSAAAPESCGGSDASEGMDQMLAALLKQYGSAGTSAATSLLEVAA